MALKDDKLVPAREVRVGACTAYGGTACGVANGGCGQGRGRSFSQSGLCQLLPTLGMLLTLKARP